MLTVLILSVISGAIVGGLGRLVLPGKQDIGWVATILSGIVASIVASLIAYVLGFHDKTLPTLILQVVLAAGCVAFVARRQAAKKNG